MTHLQAGVLFSESILGETWFQVFAGFVAFNTIVYMGLTLSKMVVWPRQSTLRAMASRLPGGPPAGGVPVQAPTSGDPGSAPGRTAPPAGPADLRSALISHDVPVALAWLGGLLIVLNVILALIDLNGGLAVHLVGVGLGVLLLVVAQVLARASVSPNVLSVAWGVAVVAIAVYLASPLTDEHNSLALAFLFILQTAFGFVLVSWRPFLVIGALTLAAAAWGTLSIEQPEPIGWLLLSLAALGVGALLTYTRLKSVLALEEAQRLSQRLATTDPLTGLLSEAGMESILPRFVATASRAGESICVMYVRAPGLAQAIAEYGRDYGDAVLRAVGDAVRDVVREGDLVARWRSDAFLVVGFGLEPDPTMLRRRLQSAVTASGVDLGKWPIVLEAGAAAGEPGDDGAVALIAAAREGAAAAPGGTGPEGAPPTSPPRS